MCSSRTFAPLIVSWLCTVSALAGNQFGLRYELSTDGANWVPALSVSPNTVVKFRMSSYFEPGVQIETPDGIGDALALNRFTGSQQVLNLAAGDVIRNVVRRATAGNAAFVSVSGSTIGTSAITSFAGQLLLDLTPLLTQPETELVLMEGEIVVGPSALARSLVLGNKTFGSGTTPGLRFYHAESLANKQFGPPAAGSVRADQNATITISGGSCPVQAFQSFTGTAVAQPALPAVFVVESGSAVEVEWSRNGVLLTDSDRYQGLGSTTLTIPRPSLGDVGSYRARVHTYCLTSAMTGPLLLTLVCSADLNRDALVDDADFGLFAVAYDALFCALPAADCLGDLNTDGFVDDLDFMIFASQYNDLVCP